MRDDTRILARCARGLEGLQYTPTTYNSPTKFGEPVKFFNLLCAGFSRHTDRKIYMSPHVHSMQKKYISNMKTFERASFENFAMDPSLLLAYLYGKREKRSLRLSKNSPEEIAKYSSQHSFSGVTISSLRLIR